MLWNALIDHEDFKMLFADRVYRHCFGDGALTETNTKARFHRLQQTLQNAIVAESARWGDSAYGLEDDPRTRHDNWQPECQSLHRLLDGNVAHFVADLQSEGLYPKVPAPTFSPATGPVAVGTQIECQLAPRFSDTHTVYYTTDGSDPRGVGSGEPSRTATIYKNQPIPVPHATRLKARARTAAGEWGPLAESLYLTSNLGFPVRITELMANPKGDQALEFVELKNLSTAVLPLGSCHFTGIDYRFPPGAAIEPNGIIVLIPNDDPAAFAKRYPRVRVTGHYRQHLSNKGERIALMHPDGSVLTSTEFGPDWPRGTKSQGRSLVATDPHSQSDAWRASPQAGGSPGL